MDRSYVAGKYNPAVTASVSSRAFFGKLMRMQVNNNVSTGQKLIGALDKVKNISDAGKGIAGERLFLFFSICRDSFVPRRGLVVVWWGEAINK